MSQLSIISKKYWITMNQIKISVNDKNLETVLTILNSLKDGIIDKIETNGKSIKAKSTQYKPKTNTIIKEEESGTNDSSGKYSVSAYKERLKRK